MKIPSLLPFCFLFSAALLCAQDVLDVKFQFQCPNQNCSNVYPVQSADQTQVALLTGGEMSLAARIRSLENAKHSIRIQALIFTADESGLYIAKILKKKKNEGLDVKVIVDSVSNLGLDKTLEIGLQTQYMYYDLKQHGIEVEGYESLYLEWMNEVSLKDPLIWNKRYHDKLWIIDAEDEINNSAILGGMNIANEYFRVDEEPSQRWRDQDVWVKGSPIVQNMAKAFDQNFLYLKSIKESKPDVFNTDRYWEKWNTHLDSKNIRIPFLKHQVSCFLNNLFENFSIPFEFNTNGQLALDEYGKPKVFYNEDWRRYIRTRKIAKREYTFNFLPTVARFVQSRPRFDESYIQQTYLNLIEKAQNEILIANAYFVPSNSIINALKNAALRGVHITILTNSLETNDLKPLAYVSRFLYHKLLGKNDLNIYEWVGHKHFEGTLHAKFAVFDRKQAIVGSYNLDPRSEVLNSETVLAFENEELANQLAQEFFTHDLHLSRFINQHEAEAYSNPETAQDKFNLYFALPLHDWL